MGVTKRTPLKRVASVISSKIAGDRVRFEGIAVDTKTNDYTIVADDLGKTLRMNAATAKTFTFPSVGAADDGARLTFVKIGAGKLTLQMVDSDMIFDTVATGTMYCVAAETYATITVEYCHATSRWNIIDASSTWTTPIVPWTQRTSGFSSTTIRCVAHNGTNLWVAAGFVGKLATSPDGITWTLRTSNFGASDIYGVAHNGSNLWAAVGVSGKLATSPDGITWTLRTSSFGSSNIYGVAHNGSNLWVAVGKDGKLATSPDGITWTQRTSSFSGSDELMGVAHNGSDLWVAVSVSGKLATSPDGITWTQRTSSFGSYGIYAVAHNGSGLWVAVGSLKIATSPDGITWTQRTSGFGAGDYIYGVAHNGSDLWVAVGKNGALATSPDGMNWAQRTSGFGADYIYGVAHNGSDLWVAVGTTGKLATGLVTVADYIFGIYLEDELKTPPAIGETTPAAAAFTQIRSAKGSDVASANALALGADGNFFDITGTTAITSIGGLKVGTVAILQFDAILTLTHHATNLILPTAGNITTAAGDVAMFVEYGAGYWKCISYMRANGTALA